MIRQWDEAMEAMHHRDEAIAVASEQFAAKKLEIRQKKAELDAQARFLEDEGMNNKEVDARIALYDREIVSRPEGSNGSLFTNYDVLAAPPIGLTLVPPICFPPSSVH